MKKIRIFTSALLVLLYAIMAVFPVYAAYDNSSSSAQIVATKKTGVSLFSESNMTKLKTRADALSKKYNINIAVVFEDKYISDATDAAESYYLSFFPKYSDGIIMYVNTYTRDYWFSTSGDVRDALSDDYGLAHMEDKVKPCLSDDEWKDACDKYFDVIDIFVSEAQDNKSYSRFHPYRTVTDIIFRIVGAIAIGVVIAIVYILIQKKKMKTVKPQQYARQYVTKNGVKMQINEDTFLYKNVTKVKIQSSSGGHGGSHSGGHGGSFGGRGGKF